jgi:LmbE family N-acetylglucosaminyl deacetylase
VAKAAVPHAPAQPLTFSAAWGAGRRIFVLIAHPDDEVVGCCAAIGRARAAGAQVFGYVLTTGVPARRVLWRWQRRGYGWRVKRRLRECRAVAELLGFASMAYPSMPTRQLRTALLDARRNILRELGRLMIDTVWAPAYEGAHADHDSANVLAASLNEGPERASVAVYEYAEYNFYGGKIRAQTFPKELGTENVLVLTPEEIEFKRKALAVYVSARRDLGFVGIERECLRPMPTYDYAKRPHPGKLFYERFQWVPFRHPRIDYTRPEQACRNFTEFREAINPQVS